MNRCRRFAVIALGRVRNSPHSFSLALIVRTCGGDSPTSRLQAEGDVPEAIPIARRPKCLCKRAINFVILLGGRNCPPFSTTAITVFENRWRALAMLSPPSRAPIAAI